MTKALRHAQNVDAALNPQPGDYWHEMFCPYFMVVAAKGERVTVLSCLSQGEHRKGELNARIDNGDGTWSLDPSKYMMVSRQWLIDAVTYRKAIDSGFCADVRRGYEDIVQGWREFRAKQLMEEFKDLGGDASLVLLKDE
jgi:hypothetical protein